MVKNTRSKPILYRGGSWDDYKWECRPATRHGCSSYLAKSFKNGGFRVVMGVSNASKS